MPADFDARATARAIAAVMEPDGRIPYEPGARSDPWDHVEAAMALAAAGRREDAERAFLWLAATQRADGSWPSALRAGRVEDPTADANFAAYVATGVYHHHLATGDSTLVEEMWPTVERGIEFAIALQAPGGEVHWARDADGRAWPEALLTGSSCIHLSLRSGLALAGVLGYTRPAWESALDRLAGAIDDRPHAFADKSRYAMDWYYPVLAGVTGGAAARRRLLERWDDFVVVGLGCRCVADRPWVTAAETAELVMALVVAGLRTEAEDVFGWLHRLRAPDGAYWTGVTFPEAEIWPLERPTWTSGAVLLAADVLAEGATARLLTPGDVAESDLEPVA